MRNKKNVEKFALWGMGILLIIIVPLITNRYSMTVVNTALIYFITTLGIMVIFGMCGQMAVSSTAFMGLGGFFTAQLSTNLGFNSVAALTLSIIGVSLVSLILGIALLRLNGIFFCFGTIALAQIASNIFNNYRVLTGGPDGIYGIPKLNIFGYEFNDLYKWFFLLCFIIIICGLIIKRIQMTSLGRGFALIRDNNIAAQTLGINVFWTKVIAFTISSALAGLAGSLLAYHNGAISPSLFSTNMGLSFLVMTVFGGANSIIGVFLGTVLITMMPEWLRPMKEYLALINGVLIVLLMVFMPSGLIGILRSMKEILLNKLKKLTKLKGDSNATNIGNKKYK